MLGPVWLTGYAADLSFIESGARRARIFSNVALDGQHHRRNTRLLNRAGREGHRLMAKPRGGNQQRPLDFVALQPFDQFRQRLTDQAAGVGNESAKAPESRIQLTDDPVGFELRQTHQRYLHVHILLDESGVIAARGETQIARVDLAGYFAETEIAVRGPGVEWIGAVNVSPGRTDQCQVHH